MKQFTVGLLLFVSSLGHCQTIVPPKCITETELLDSVEANSIQHPLVSVVVVEEQLDETSYSFRVLEPNIRGNLTGRGTLNTEFCTRLTFTGDVIIAFAFPNPGGGILVDQSIRLYSLQWDLVWSEEAIRWLETWNNNGTN